MGGKQSPLESKLLQKFLEIVFVGKCVTESLRHIAEGLVCSNAHRLGVIADGIFDEGAVGVPAEDDADSWVLVRLSDLVIKDLKIAVQLAKVCSFEFPGFKFDDHKAVELTVEEQQVAPLLLPENFQVVLVTHVGEIFTKSHHKALYVSDDGILYHALVYVVFIGGINVLQVNVVQQVFILEHFDSLKGLPG